MHARRALAEQLGGLGGRVGHAQLGHRARVVLARGELAPQRRRDGRAAQRRDPFDHADRS